MSDKKSKLDFLKKAGSLQFKFLITVISAMLAITIFIGGLCIYEMDRYIQRETKSLVETTCANEATKVNDIFGDMEKSVKIMESYVIGFLESKNDIANHSKQDEIIRHAGAMFENVAKHTNGAIAYYLRFDPTISDAKAGLFYSQVDGGDEYVRFEPTDISAYDRNDTEHVGWFWQPYDAGAPLWMKPYYNQNNNVLMISYVIPMYYEDLFIGVIGMDFDYTVLSNKVQQIKLYENGFAHLEIDGAVVHPDGYEAETLPALSSQDYLQVSESLINGMTLVLSASYDDIQQIRYDITLKIVLATLLLAVFFSAIVVFVVKKTVTPLKKLTEAAISLSNRNYDVETVHTGTYEIKLLNAAFENMADRLREHEQLQQLLTYHDSLTGLRNTTSYKAWITDFNKEIENESVRFDVIVFDINYLKETNDKYGHHVGNQLIVTAAQIISDTFKRSPVFRIGGDEFLAILQNRDLEARDELLAKFDQECAMASAEADEKKIPISIAKGVASYDPQKDTKFVDVFNRADEAMYENKRQMKSQS